MERELENDDINPPFSLFLYLSILLSISLSLSLSLTLTVFLNLPQFLFLPCTVDSSPNPHSPVARHCRGIAGRRRGGAGLRPLRRDRSLQEGRGLEGGGKESTEHAQ